MSTIISFVYFGFQVKWNPPSSNNSRRTSYLHWAACWDVIWPADLQTRCCQLNPLFTIHCCRSWVPSKPLEHNGRPLDLQVHWDATRTTLVDVITQWFPIGNSVVICIIGSHWKTTGRLLEAHCGHIGNTLATPKIIYPVAFQMYIRY